MNGIGKREERKPTGYPRISGADGRTPLPVAHGIKAVPMHRERTPRPGGQGSAPVLRSGSAHPPQWLCYGGRATEGGLHPLRQGMSVADGGLAGMRWIPESEGDFVLYYVGDEWVMPQDCPGKAPP